MFCKGFSFIFHTTDRFRKTWSFAHHANILVDLGSPKPGYLKAAGPKPPNHLSRWWTMTAKRPYFRMRFMKRKIGPYGPSPFLSALDPNFNKDRSRMLNAQCRHGCLHGARSTPIRIGVPNGDRAAEPADAQGANLIGQWISIIERTPSSGAKISRRDHDFVIKKSPDMRLRNHSFSPKIRR